MSNGFEIHRTIHIKFMLWFSIAVYEHKYFLVVLKPKIATSLGLQSSALSLAYESRMKWLYLTNSEISSKQDVGYYTAHCQFSLDFFL